MHIAPPSFGFGIHNLTEWLIILALAALIFGGAVRRDGTH